MPPSEWQHRTRAELNEQFAEQIDKSDPIRENWAVTATFYAAMHYVGQYFARNNIACEKHDEIHRTFRGDFRIKAVYASYKYLADLSHTARYKCVPLPHNIYESEVRARLAAVKMKVEDALKHSAPSSPMPVPAKVVEVKKVSAQYEDPKPMPGKPDSYT